MREFASSPVRIERIGTDHVQVFIRRARSDAEIALGVRRIEQLFDAGYDAIDVVFDASSRVARRTEQPTDVVEALGPAPRAVGSARPISREDTE